MSEEESLALLEKYNDWTNKFVSFSGGKDSLTVLHLASKVWDDFKVLYVDTGICLPEHEEYVNNFLSNLDVETVILHPERKFWDLVERWGFPRRDPAFRWCMHELKLKPIKKFMFGLRGRVMALGIRRKESTQRMLAYDSPFSSYTHDKWTRTNKLHPILDWTGDEVLSYLHKANLPINPCYRIYGTTGCYYCPFNTKLRYYATLRRLHPELFNKIVEAESKMRKKGSALFKGGRHIYLTDLLNQKVLKEKGIS